MEKHSADVSIKTAFYLRLVCKKVAKAQANSIEFEPALKRLQTANA